MLCRTDLPGGKIWPFLCAGLLILPTYVLISGWDAVIGPIGWAKTLISQLDGSASANVQIQGGWGKAIFPQTVSIMAFRWWSAVLLHSLLALPGVVLILSLGAFETGKRTRGNRPDALALADGAFASLASPRCATATRLRALDFCNRQQRNRRHRHLSDPHDGGRNLPFHWRQLDRSRGVSLSRHHPVFVSDCRGGACSLSPSRKVRSVRNRSFRMLRPAVFD